MFRLKVAAVVIGAVLAFLGVQEFRVSQGTSVEPVDADLAAIESGEDVPNNHVRLGEHVAVYAASVYQYRQGKYDTSEPGPDTRVEYVYYPVISHEHEFFDALNQLAEKYGSLDEAPENVWPTIDSIGAIVKSRKFGTIGDIPAGMHSEESVEGLVINMIGGLSSDEKSLLRESFPQADFDDILIIEEDRRPASAIKSLGMAGGGALLSLLGVGGLIAGRRA